MTQLCWTSSEAGGTITAMSTDQESKTPTQSRVEMTQIILPGDANSLGNAFGGKIMQWIDVAAGVAARRHAGSVSVTASMDSLTFHRPIRLGDVVVMYASVNRAWKTSMEVGVRVLFEEEGSEVQKHAASAYLTFVAVGEDGRPREVPKIIPSTSAEKRRFDEAQQRRGQRLGRRGHALKG